MNKCSYQELVFYYSYLCYPISPLPVRMISIKQTMTDKVHADNQNVTRCSALYVDHLVPPPTTMQDENRSHNVYKVWLRNHPCIMMVVSLAASNI